jgi:hypothetical protein
MMVRVRRVFEREVKFSPQQHAQPTDLLLVTHLCGV